MKKIVLIIVAIIFSSAINAQENKSIKKNNIFLELGGAGVLGSLNYERMLSDNEDLNFPLRIGTLFLYGGSHQKTLLLMVPLSISVIKKMYYDKKVYWEVKGIVSYYYLREVTPKDTWRNEPKYISNTSKLMPGVSFGIRRFDFTGGFYYHIHLQVLYNYDKSLDFLQPWFSIGLGHVF